MRIRASLAVFLLGLLAGPAGAEDAVTGTASMRDAVTIAIDGARYRIEGIEPPAEGATCGAQSCLDAAMSELTVFAANGPISCAKTRRLGHGFFLASCRLADGTDVAEHLLQKGLAELGADAGPAQRAASEQAKAAKLGVWANF